MARSRSRRRNSRFRRLALPVGAAAVLVASVYFLLPGRSPPSAEARPGAAAPAQPLLEAQKKPPLLAAESNAQSESPGAKPEASGAPAESGANPNPVAPAPSNNDSPAPAEPVSGNPAAPDSTGQPAKPGSEPAGKADSSVAPDPTTRSAPRAPAAPGNLQALVSQSILLQDQGKLLEARAIINDALQAGALDHPAAETLKARIRQLNQTIVFAPTRRFPDDPQQSEYVVQPGDVLVKICRNLDVPAGFIARVNAVQPERIRQGQSLKIIKGPVHAVVSKKHFTMDLYLGALPGQPGSMYLDTYRVGLGEDGSTPTGLWEVPRGAKAQNPSWVNPRTNERFAADDPNNPLGERWIGLTGVSGAAVGAVSYGIHGTIEPESIGKNASMGCIRLLHDDVVALFDMLSEGRSTVLVIED